MLTVADRRKVRNRVIRSGHRRMGVVHLGVRIFRIDLVRRVLVVSNTVHISNALK